MRENICTKDIELWLTNTGSTDTIDQQPLGSDLAVQGSNPKVLAEEKGSKGQDADGRDAIIYRIHLPQNHNPFGVILSPDWGPEPKQHPCLPGVQDSGFIPNQADARNSQNNER